MDLLGYQLLTVADPSRNPPGGQKRLAVWNIDSLFLKRLYTRK